MHRGAIRRSVLAAVAVIGLTLAAGCSGSGTLPAPHTSSVGAPSAPTGPVATATAHPPTPGSVVTSSASTPKLDRDSGRALIQSCAHPAADWDDVAEHHGLDPQGYASVDSAVAGTDIGLYVAIPYHRYRVQAYRMGYYGENVQACEVWTSSWLTGHAQPAALVVGSVREPTAPWKLSLTVGTAGWAPGDYLFRVDGGSPEERQFIPLTLRSPSFAGRVVIIMPDTTWQAYNFWGGHSLYYGNHHAFSDRARIVPFDRPYDWGKGAGDFITGELPLIALAEKLRLPVGYATDVDLQRDPAAFLHARLIASAGHDEYYSPGMRNTLTEARDHGVNLAFLGANDAYRKIRFADTPLGPDRAIINYKDDTDPIGVPDLVTTQWRDPPSNDPESSLTGDDYRCSAGAAPPSLVVADAGIWLFAGTGVADGTSLSRIGGQEFDGITTWRPVPRPITVLFHGPATCHGRGTTQDSTYYTTPSGAGVLDVGAFNWDCALVEQCPVPVDAKTAGIVTRITTNFLLAAAVGPLGRQHPAIDNLRTFYPHAAPAPR